MSEVPCKARVASGHVSFLEDHQTPPVIFLDYQVPGNLLQSKGRNVKRFRGRPVFKAHILLYHSTLGLRVINKKKK